MAFNPFHSFRRYSKWVFAGLVLIAMFSFVLSASGGLTNADPLAIFGNWLGRSRNPALVTIYGQEFDARQIQQVQLNRRLANYFMDAAVIRVQESILNRVVTDMPKYDPEVQQLLQRVVQTRFFALRLGGQFQDQYRAELSGSGFMPGFIRMLQEAIDRSAAQKKNDQADLLVSMQHVLLQDRVRLERGPGELYFGGRESNLDDTTNFLIWRHEADRLGLRFTAQEMDSEVNNETFGQLSLKDQTEIIGGLRNMFRNYYSPETLSAAMADEFRVRAAQSALVGVSARTLSAIPAVLTPDEAWELYRDQRTAVRVSVVELAVKSELPQVTGTPAEADLRKLYDQYKNDEPAPERDQPGFKEPRYLKVEWLGAQPDLPYYKTAAAKVAPVKQALLQIGGAATATDALGGGLGMAAAAATPVVLDAPLVREFGDYESRTIPWTDNTTPWLHETSIVRPENVAILVGEMMGSAGTGGSVLSGPLALEGRVLVREVRDRARVGVTQILAAALDPAPLGEFGIPYDVVPKPLSLDVLRGQLQAKTRDELARQLVLADLKSFEAEVTKKGQERDKKDVQQYVADFVKERGLKHGATQEARDRYSIGSDPGLAPLKEAYQKGHGRQDAQGRFFANAFFEGRENTLYQPAQFPAFGDEAIYRFWRTEDREPRVLSFDKARPKVEEAWKYLRARELAQKAADVIADEARMMNGDPQKLRDLAATGKLEYFEIGPQAARNPKMSPFPGQPKEYEPFRVPEDKVTYPGDMGTQIVDLRKKAKGATVVVTDQPKAHFYVTVLTQKDPPTQDEFRRTYIESTPRASGYDPFLAQLALEKRIQYRRDVLTQLRSEANVVVHEEAKRKAGDETE
jgi:hypothetical protein